MIIVQCTIALTIDHQRRQEEMRLTGNLVWWPDEELSSEALVDALAINITAKPKIG